jgi:predicted TIM-barrel fold metal-dependent hydrolase
MSIDAALDEIQFCKANGACAVFLRAIEGDRLLYDPYFYPVYEAASRLNMAMVVHVAVANPDYLDLVGQYNGRAAGFWKFRLPTVGAMHSLLMSELPDRFPELRWGFLEAGAQWIPHVLKDIRRRTGAPEIGPHMLKDKNVYVACETEDDLDYVLKYSGEDNLVIGTDYGHTDPGTEVDAISVLRKQGQVPDAVFNKIVDDNPRALYGI